MQQNGVEVRIRDTRDILTGVIINPTEVIFGGGRNLSITPKYIQYTRTTYLPRGSVVCEPESTGQR